MSIKIPSILTVAALAAACVVAVPQKASADERGDCQKKVEKAQDHYRHEAHEHGKHSRQAQEARANRLGPQLRLGPRRPGRPIANRAPEQLGALFSALHHGSCFPVRNLQ
jgi:hypothetical protein